MAGRLTTQALSLYRRLLRASRQWQGAKEVRTLWGTKLPPPLPPLRRRRRRRRSTWPTKRAPPPPPPPPHTQEADYIAQEARQQFRSQQHSRASPEHVARLLEEGEARLALAQHYKIAYPRLHHGDQFAKVCRRIAAAQPSPHRPRCFTAVCPSTPLPQVPYVQAPQLEATEQPEAVARGVKDAAVAAKLAAAAQRRRERLAQQQQQRQLGQPGQGHGGTGT